MDGVEGVEGLDGVEGSDGVEGVDGVEGSDDGVVGVSGIFSTVATCGYGSVERFDVELTTDGPPLAAPPGKNIAKPTSKIVRATIPITVSRKRRLAFATCASLSRAVSHNVPAQITPIVPATAMPALMTVVTVCAMPLVPPQKNSRYRRQEGLIRRRPQSL